MKKLTKSQEKLLEQIKEFLLTLDNTDKDEWYDTDRGFHESCLKNFLNHLGLDLPED